MSSHIFRIYSPRKNAALLGWDGGGWPNDTKGDIRGWTLEKGITALTRRSIMSFGPLGIGGAIYAWGERIRGGRVAACGVVGTRYRGNKRKCSTRPHSHGDGNPA